MAKNKPFRREGPKQRRKKLPLFPKPPRMGAIVARRAILVPHASEPAYVVRMALSEMDELCKELRAHGLERFAWEIEVCAPGKVDPATGVWVKEAKLSHLALKLIREKLSPHV
jgi:hypothetical protein